ncbi:MAG TPA: amidohydrolase family protein [Vicinamibacterales bacterium]|nr:amidohydrolase family protein [Vicinamibacterales bacterium]
MFAHAVCLVNVRVVADGGVAGTLRFSSRILGLGDAPRAGDTVIDGAGAVVLPGLVNAHDHLELNHYGRLKCRERYLNASQWIDDLRPRLSADPAIRDGRAHPLGERLFIGALKNLLAGVTTVAHHNPFYPELRRTIPIRIVRRYGWAHSFQLERQPAGARGEPGGDVAERSRATPADAPFMVHLAEGVDEAAGGELPRLEALGCLKPNTVIVHGVAIDGSGWRRVAQAGAGLVWCPASNEFLFGRTAPIRELLDLNGQAPAIALGTDSRVTGSRDLLDELRVARDAEGVRPEELFAMVTTSAAALLHQPRIGRLSVGGVADLVMLQGVGSFPQVVGNRFSRGFSGENRVSGVAAVANRGSARENGPKRDEHRENHSRRLVENTVGRENDSRPPVEILEALLAATRRDVRLVVVDGRPLVADPDLAPAFEARRVVPRPIRVDETLKIADSGLARRIAGCPIVEPGVSAV